MRPLFPDGFHAQDPQGKKNIDDQRELEKEHGGKDQGEKKRNEIPDPQNRLHGFPRKGEGKPHHGGNDEEQRHGDPQKGKKKHTQDRKEELLFLLFMQGGQDESPDLAYPVGERKKERQKKGELELDEKRLHEGKVVEAEPFRRGKGKKFGQQEGRKEPAGHAEKP